MQDDSITFCKKSFWETIRIDRQLNSTKSFAILFLYRIHHVLYVHNLRILELIWRCIESILIYLLRIDAQISYKAEIGNSIRLPHSAMGVVISSKAYIGNNVTIYHQVTIGINERKADDEKRIIVKDNCYLSTGCKIISCIVGEGATIGPNAVVYKDLDPYSLYVSNNIIITR